MRDLKKDEWNAFTVVCCTVGIILIWLASLSSCSFNKTVSDPTPLPLPPSTVETSLKGGLTPKFKCLDCTFNSTYEKAINLLQYANTDEFESYFLKKRIKLSHVDGKSPTLVIKTFRAQLSLQDEISVSFYWQPFSAGIGAWDVDRIKQNTKFTFAPIPLAGHLLHEVSHKYGWIHIGNKKFQFDNLDSAPYAFGNEFVSFLTEKGL